MKIVTMLAQSTLYALLLMSAPCEGISFTPQLRNRPSIVIAFDLHEVLMKIDVKQLFRTAFYALATSPRNTLKIAYDYLRDREFDLTQQTARNIFNSQYPITETWNIASELTAEGFPLFLFSNIESQTFTELKERYPERFSLFQGFHTVHSKEQQKPALSAFLSFEELLKSFGYIRPIIIFIDDNPANIAIARKIGWYPIHYKNSKQLANALEQTLGSLMQRPAMLY